MKAELLKELVLHPNFIGLADSYIPYITAQGKESYKEVLESKLQNLETGEFLVPVLGIQGTGKSSLLNALFMDDLVLPVDADETTCIPVEIRYGRHNDGEVHVFFEGRSDSERFYDKSILEQYVHNRFNPGNQKQVSHIVIYKNDELLANQVVLVDLPGIGSMTVSNVETTMKYIEKLSAAVFLLRTVPPITRPERIFLTHTWPKLSAAWFIQNQWNDESQEEVIDGKAHNEAILQEIAGSYQTKPPGDIRVINVYKGLNARLENDAQAYQSSGMGELREMLSSVTDNWQSVLTEGFTLYIGNLVQAIEKKLSERKHEFTMSSEELRVKFSDQEQEYEEAIRRNRKRITDFSDKLSEHRMGLMDYAAAISKEQEENLRSEMRRVIGSGVVDGELLNRAFTETCDTLMADTLEEMSQKLFEIQKDIAVLLEDLEIQDINGDYDRSGQFTKKEAFKFEKALPTAFGIAGGTVGGFVGLKVGAAIGTIVGPAGTVIGAIGGMVVGTGIAIVSSWFGSKAKQKVGEARQKYTLRDLESPIRGFRNMLKSKVESSCDDMFTRLEDALRQFKEIQQEELRIERQMHNTILQQRESTLVQDQLEVEENEKFLIWMEGQLV